MAAPVVPIQLAMIVPKNSRPVLTAGEPFKVPFKRTPPATVNSDSSKMINGMYSSSATCTNS